MVPDDPTALPRLDQDTEDLFEGVAPFTTDVFFVENLVACGVFTYRKV